jgi:D-serine deaminase-like pyridoxal phosphate-dependent protein
MRVVVQGRECSSLALESGLIMIGTMKSDIETPALLIDLDLMDKNLAKMSEYFSTRRQKLRAHSKTHKSPIIAHKQISRGSSGICVQKLSEAEVMVNGGLDDVLITNEVADPRKMRRLVALNNYADVKVAVDNAATAAILSDIAMAQGKKQPVVVEVDVRNKRCGTPPGKATVDLVERISSLSGLEFRGVMGYEGPFLDVTDFSTRKERASKLVHLLTDTVEMIERRGIHVEVVSAGATGTYNITGDCDGITEVEAGSYVFMDSTYRRLQGLGFECALTVLGTVISRPLPERVIVDVGWKAVTPELGIPEVKDMEGVKLHHLSEEHGLISVEGGNSLRVGDKLEIVPSHCCTTVNLYETYYGIRRQQVEAEWPVAARGRSQ